VAVLRSSAAGHLWNAVRENEVRAAALGVDVRRQRVIAYAVAGAVAGVAGVVFALSIQTVTPSTMSVSVTDELAGTRTVQDLSDPIERAVTSQPLILGTVYILFVLFLPGGLVALGRRRR
jgi:branched-chain amino acid transport system permease protein